MNDEQKELLIESMRDLMHRTGDEFNELLHKQDNMIISSLNHFECNEAQKNVSALLGIMDEICDFRMENILRRKKLIKKTVQEYIEKYIE